MCLVTHRHHKPVLRLSCFSQNVNLSIISGNLDCHLFIDSNIPQLTVLCRTQKRLILSCISIASPWSKHHITKLTLRMRFTCNVLDAWIPNTSTKSIWALLLMEVQRTLNVAMQSKYPSWSPHETVSDNLTSSIPRPSVWEWDKHFTYCSFKSFEVWSQYWIGYSRILLNSLQHVRMVTHL